MVVLIWEVLGLSSCAVTGVRSKSESRDSIVQDQLVVDTMPKRSAELWDSLTTRVDTLSQKVNDTITLPIKSNDTIAPADTLSRSVTDTIAPVADTLLKPIQDSLLKDSTLTQIPARPKEKKKFLDAPIHGKNKDSLVYDVKNKVVYVYGDGDVKYEKMGLMADYIRLDTEKKGIKARGVSTEGSNSQQNKAPGSGLVDKPKGDTTNTVYKKPIFKEGTTEYAVDSIDYNMDSQKAFIHGITTKEGEGFLYGGQVKKMKDGVTHMRNGRYTTCDHEYPHFYLDITKGTVTQKKKTVFGPAYMVIEDVPIYILGLPFGFFPQMSDKGNSGFIFPEIGEEVVRGFFLRNGGYYFMINDNIDLRLTAGIYTLGSWQMNAASNYYKRYKFQGNLSFDYASDVIGEVGATDYVNSTNMRIQWSHRQDPKATPGSTFSASVNFSTSNYSKYNAQTSQDYLNTQTNSSISYQKSWVGKPFTFSANGNLSQNSKTAEYTFNLPAIAFGVSRITPFKRKLAIGKEKWYEKINTNYNFNFNNTTGAVKESDLFSQKMFDQMTYSARHSLPISASFNVFQYLNITPGVNYNETWSFRRINQDWNPESGRVEVTDTVRGFNRVYDYSVSMGFNTNLYGMYTVGRDAKAVRVRHVMSPTVSLSYKPGFGQFYRAVQTYTAENPDKPDKVYYYSPYTEGVPSRNASASLSFSVNNTLEMRVPSDRDTTGSRKIKLIEGLSISSSYNFIADSLKLAPFSVGLRTTLFKGFALNVNSSFDPYQIDKNGQKINMFQIKNGSLARLVSAGTSFSYSFSGGRKSGSSGGAVQNARNNPATMGQRQLAEVQNEAFFSEKSNASQVDMAREAASQYYDFSIPWSFGFNYSINYSKPGHDVSVNQTLGFNGNVTVTEKWSASFNGGYDIKMKKISNADVQISRDLHCWQMSLSWVPIGYRKSWSFSIKATSSMLADLLKWDKRNSYLDNQYAY